MSKKSASTEVKKLENLDILTNAKILSYTINVKDSEITQQAEYIKELISKMTHLEKEYSDLKANYLQTFRTEKTIKQMQILLEQEQRNVESLKEELRNKAKEYKEEKDELTKKYESELSTLRNIIELHQKKIDNVHNLQNLIEKQEEQIKHLNQQKENTLKDSENYIRKKDIKNQIKFSDLKKKMMQNIQETQKNVTELNIEYMDVSTKLTLLQNHQLLIEIQYQSEQIEELLKKKEFLEKKVFELNKDLEVHREVELSLAEKNKVFSEKIKILEKKINSLTGSSVDATIQNNQISDEELIQRGDSKMHKSDESFKAAKSIHINSNIKNFTVALNLEKKIGKLESILKKKQEEINKMRENYHNLEDKLKSYESTLSGISFLLEDGFKSLANEEELNKQEDIQIDLNKIKSGKIKDFTKEEKFFVIDSILKILIPLFDFKENQGNYSPIATYKSNIIAVHKHLEDPVMKLIFSSNSKNMLYSVKRKLEKLPMINKSSGSSYSKSGSISQLF
jgi:hypothetical protein